ncbi:hypothetical protein E3N88_08025 [Mikania micrantha]|uniref:Large ribosomal subunit protein uL2 C-terminal domain-containing protein n=1 Tax=Mikania micrantha TaxID=192012 RepID=A0A5N6PF17_9ASTR|nr:hypothetical protein E3N88_08025 [Mikania micrantha]
MWDHMDDTILLTTKLTNEAVRSGILSTKTQTAVGRSDDDTSSAVRGTKRKWFGKNKTTASAETSQSNPIVKNYGAIVSERKLTNEAVRSGILSTKTQTAVGRSDDDTSSAVRGTKRKWFGKNKTTASAETSQSNPIVKNYGAIVSERKLTNEAVRSGILSTKTQTAVGRSDDDTSSAVRGTKRKWFGKNKTTASAETSQSNPIVKNYGAIVSERKLTNEAVRSGILSTKTQTAVGRSDDDTSSAVRGTKRKWFGKNKTTASAETSQSNPIVKNYGAIVSERKLTNEAVRSGILSTKTQTAVGRSDDDTSSAVRGTKRKWFGKNKTTASAETSQSNPIVKNYGAIVSERKLTNEAVRSGILSTKTQTAVGRSDDDTSSAVRGTKRKWFGKNKTTASAETSQSNPIVKNYGAIVSERKLTNEAVRSGILSTKTQTAVGRSDDDTSSAVRGTKRKWFGKNKTTASAETSQSNPIVKNYGAIVSERKLTNEAVRSGILSTKTQTAVGRSDDDTSSAVRGTKRKWFGKNKTTASAETSQSNPIVKNYESTSTDMPLGTAIHNIEITLGKGGQLARAAGGVAKLIAKEGKSATLKLPSGEVRLISKNCSATVGQVGNVGVNQKSLGRVGSKRWLGKRPVVRGVVMNPVDHPHGGGEGRAPSGRKKPTTPWGYLALGKRNRKRNKYSDNLILRRRSK